jgi:putative flavoprotein involved in K+ transport
MTRSAPRGRRAPAGQSPARQGSVRQAPVREIDTLVIGAGQAGLSVSYHLSRRGRPHLVIERDAIGARWRAERWDSFTLVTPNWMLRLPGFAYRGDDPHGFLARDQIVAYLEAYARAFGAPVETGVTAERLAPDGAGYRVETDRGPIAARNVVVTVGYFHKPALPACARSIAPAVHQIHSSQYRSPAALPAGAVLVVGSAQSGCQIAEELHQAGRRVYLSLGSAGRFPMRYRGRDTDAWLADMGAYDAGFADPANPVERYRPNPHASGKNGGRSLNLRRFARDGITLLGRLTGSAGTRLRFAADVNRKVAAADRFSRDIMSRIDAHIAANAIAAPAPDALNTDDGDDRFGEFGLGDYGGEGRGAGAAPPLPEIASLDLAARGIASIVWATGYACDFAWIDLPVTDARGYPRQERGVSPFPGLYFCGLHWMYSLGSGLFFGVGEAAGQVVDHLDAARPPQADSASAISM